MSTVLLAWVTQVWMVVAAARLAKAVAAVAVFAALLCGPQPAAAQFVQQGPKLVGTGAVGFQVAQGWSVALSGDGNTALIGGIYDNSNAGAAWVFTRINGMWTQQGQKLVGSGAGGSVGAFQGQSVALSADGNTAAVGGREDDDGLGAVWVFTRGNGVWTQQGPKLVGTGVVGSFPAQGYSVALSADGNTVVVGAPSDNDAGAAWVFTRSNGAWTQQGQKLVGTGSVGYAGQGWSVALSGDGNTAMLGGYNDNNNFGAAWVFTRSNGAWTQQGPKLVGTGAVGIPFQQLVPLQGWSVALSFDGDTAILGGWGDDPSGAAWVFTRSNGAWTQQGPKLVGTGGSGNPQQGYSVALSGDGNTAVIGGQGDNALVGAAWAFTRSNGAWTQQGQKLVGTGVTTGSDGQQGWSVSLSADGSTALVGGPSDNSLIGAAWVFAQPSLQVTPGTDIAASGHQGGPFTPSSFQYQLNTATGSQNYTISSIPLG
jgi:hypothetical protein